MLPASEADAGKATDAKVEPQCVATLAHGQAVRGVTGSPASGAEQVRGYELEAQTQAQRTLCYLLA